jgi:hypothetical protein
VIKKSLIAESEFMSLSDNVSTEKAFGSTTVVKELRSKMLGQHPGYFKVVFLKKTQIMGENS